MLDETLTGSTSTGHEAMYWISVFFGLQRVYHTGNLMHTWVTVPLGIYPRV